MSLFLDLRQRHLSVLFSFLPVACAQQPGARAPDSSSRAVPTTDAERYLPLNNGHVYSYDSENEDTGERGIVVMEVSRSREQRANFVIGGRVSARLEIRPDGIAHVEGGYLLKTPLGSDATWKGKFGSVRVSHVDRDITVPAGRFVGCVETTEETSSTGGSKKVVSVYCPDVGMVSLDVEVASDRGLQRERVLLRSFGPRVDLAAPPAAPRPQNAAP